MATKKKAAARRGLPAKLRKAVDNLVVKASGKNAMECLIKSSHSPNFPRYEIYGLSNGTTLYVNVDKLTAKVMDPSCALAKRFAKRHAEAR